MTVALFASAFYPHVGGVEELVRQLAHAYRRAGVGAIVLTNRWPRSLPRQELYEGIPVYRLAFRVPTGHWRADTSHALTARAVQRQTDAILRRHGADIVHVQCVSCQAPYAARAAERVGLPLVVTLQGELSMDAAGAFQRQGIGQDILRQCLSQAAAITGCSRNTLSEAETFFGRPFGDRGHVIHNGVRVADFEAARPHAHPAPYVLGIGRLVPQKGFDVLLRAFAMIKGELPGLNLILAGEGPEVTNLRQLAAELGLSDRITFFGRADRAQAASLFAGCEFFVLPSRHEPFGIVNLEAMASGKAIVASRVGGVPEFVEHDATGILVPPDDPAALAAAIGRLGSDRAERQRLGAAGREHAREFDWPTIAANYVSIYRDRSGTADPEAPNGVARVTGLCPPRTCA